MVRQKAVTLVMRVKTVNGWARYPAAFGPTGKVIKDTVVVDGKHEVHPEGLYQVRTYVGRVNKYANVVPNSALEARKVLDKAVNLAKFRAEAKEKGIELAEPLREPAAGPKTPPLKQWLDDCVDDLMRVRKAEVMANFVLFVGNQFLDALPPNIRPEEIKPRDLQDYIAKLVSEGYAKRTVENRYAALKRLLQFSGVDVRTKEMRAIKPPKSEVKVPEFYTKAERDAFFAACETPRERLIFNLALKLGLREQELMYLDPSEFNFETRTVTIHSKSEEGFQIKDKEERTLPVPQDLQRMVREYMQANPGIRWLTGKDGKPDGHMHRLSVQIAKRADLTCRVFLHKFRATYATTLLRNKVDIKTVQALMGHSDLSSTLKYLRAIEAEDAHLQATVNKIDW